MASVCSARFDKLSEPPTSATTTGIWPLRYGAVKLHANLLLEQNTHGHVPEQRVFRLCLTFLLQHVRDVGEGQQYGGECESDMRSFYSILEKGGLFVFAADLRLTAVAGSCHPRPRTVVSGSFPWPATRFIVVVVGLSGRMPPTIGCIHRYIHFSNPIGSSRCHKVRKP